MKAGSRSKGIGRWRRGRESRPGAENPFAPFHEEAGATPRVSPAPTPTPTPTASRKPAPLPTPAPPPRADASPKSRTRGKPASARPPVPGPGPAVGPRQWLRRVVALAVLFFLVMPLTPVLLLRIVPPPASTMMLKRWVDARAAGREFDLEYHWVSSRKIARSLGAAVVASEDQRFYDHGGFDWKELRNAVDEWRDGGSLRGASTISQQVAKNLFLWPGRSFLRKVFEAWFTLWIEWLWPKERILEVYLNIAELGDGVFGAEAAARRYFKHPAAKLVPHESALLAAMLPSPLRSNPANPSPYLRQRQRWILRHL